MTELCEGGGYTMETATPSLVSDGESVPVGACAFRGNKGWKFPRGAVTWQGFVLRCGAP